MTTFAERMSHASISPTLATAARAKALAAQGISVIDFSVGEPDFPTPPHIVAACNAALTRGETKYGATAGLLELRTAIAARLTKDYGTAYAADEILITVGAKEGLFAAQQVLLNPGDEIIIPAPYWVSYPEQAQICSATPVFVNTTPESGFKLTPAELANAITPRTKMLLLNHPSNPTGAVYTKAELRALAEVLQQHPHVWTLVDEMYEFFVYAPATFTSFIQAAPELRERTIIVNGFSKSYAMTGWRLGYVAAPKAACAQMTTWHSQVVTHPTLFAQHGALAAATGDQSCVTAMRDAFAKRRDCIVELMRTIPGLAVQAPAGAFFLFVDVRNILAKSTARGVATSAALADYLLDQSHIAVVAGEGFGMRGFLRFSYALGLESLREGMERFAKAVMELTK